MTYNTPICASSLSYVGADKKCEECKKWEAENWNNPEGAVRECDCQFDYQPGMGIKRTVILPTCQKCGSAPCGWTSEERYGRPIAPENDLQVQTVGSMRESKENICRPIIAKDRKNYRILRGDIIVLSVVAILALAVIFLSIILR